MSERQAGELKFWRENDTKRFGFITPDHGGADVFISGYCFDDAGIETPAIGDRLTFLVVEAQDGRLKASDVRREGDEGAAERVFNPVRHEPVRQ